MFKKKQTNPKMAIRSSPHWYADTEEDNEPYVAVPAVEDQYSCESVDPIEAIAPEADDVPVGNHLPIEELELEPAGTEVDADEHEPVPATSHDEGVVENETPPVTERETEKTDKNKSRVRDTCGYLFMCCIRCTSMIAIKFSTKRLPSIPGADLTTYANGMVMTSCKACLRKVANAYTNMDTFSNKFVTAFETLQLSADLIVGSKPHKAACLVMGGDVPVVRQTGAIMYFTLDKMMEKLCNQDAIMSVDVSMVVTNDRDKVLLSHVCGGFI